jgi:HEAT repeat protein
VTSEKVSNKKYIAEVLDSNEILTISALSHLSNLNADDLDFFKKSWSRINTERKRQVISQMAHLSRDNFRLNFSEIFIYCLYDIDSKIRVASIAGLSEEENFQYISPLVHILKKDRSPEVREAAVTALGNFALQGEIGKLPPASTTKIYEAFIGILDDKASGIETRCLALVAIAPLSLPRVKDLIEEAYHSNDIKLKISAIRAMGRNCDPMWLKSLLNALESGNNELLHEAVRAIGELGAEEALPDLIKLLEDANIDLQEAVIRALGEIGGDESRQALSELSQNPQQAIRRAAKAALKELDFCNDPLTLKSIH